MECSWNDGETQYYVIILDWLQGRSGELEQVLELHVRGPLTVNWVKNSVKEFVEITDLGEIYWLLGIELKRDHEASKLMLSQRSYISTSLYRFRLKDTKPVSTPINPVMTWQNG